MSQTIIVIGPPKSGKTFLMHHLTRSYFEPFKSEDRYKPTIGIDIIGQNVIGNIRYVYYDSSGQDRFLAITQPYFIKCDVIMIVFDLGTQDFQDLNKWYDLAKCVHKPTIIVGTKHDLVGEGSEEALLACVKFGQGKECPFYPTSSVTGMGITQLRNSLQTLIPEQRLVERATKKRNEQEETKKKRTKEKKRRQKQTVRKLFCCISRGYSTIEDEEDKIPPSPSPSPPPSPPSYPVTDLGVSV